MNTVSICGLGTGVGQLPCNICAKQMKQAYDEIWLGKKQFPENYSDAQKKHLELNLQGYKDLQY